MFRKRRVVVTGLGVVAPNGVGKDEFWQATVQGKSGVDYITSFDTSNLDSKIAAQVKGFNPLNYMSTQVAKRTDRFVHFGLASARMALEDSGLNLSKEDKNRIGVVIGSVFGGVLFHEEQIMAGLQKGLNRVHPLSIPKVSTNSVSSNIAIEFDFTGLNLSISTGCVSGTNAIGQAFRLIQNNTADIVFSGGVEAPITPITFSAFCNLQLLSKKNDQPQEACRPFDKKRDGFALGEGGAVLILEELSHAIKRNACIYGEIHGYAANCGSYHMVLPEAGGKESARVIQMAIDDADIPTDAIDYISAYGNATQPNDKAETKAIKLVFGRNAYNIPISSIKSMIGHTVGASGAIEAVSCALALENNRIPPTINYEYPDHDCDLDYVPNKARKARLNTVLLNSFGVGNNNACVVFKRFMD
ncbi:MAG: beta-ketoacyl-ACP synthase II [Nitrospirae bacterium]|nr:beta-ketoacyl-ACP synthase II [Nitrospirota bacterium]